MPRFRVGLLAVLLSYIVALAFPVKLTGAPLAQEGQAIITSPSSNTQVAGLIQITGSATHPQFQRYELAWSMGATLGENWAVFAFGDSPIENGVLGLWDTRQVPDGLYSLRLRVIRVDGNYSENFVLGIRVSNTEPTHTPTPPLGPTIPPEVTEVPTTPLPELIVQPPTSTPPPPTPTPASSSATGSGDTPLAGPLSFRINVSALSEAFCQGATYTFGAFVLWGLVLSVRGLARWVLRRLVSRQVNR